MNKTKQLLLIFLIVIIMAAFCGCDEDPSLQTAKYKGSITVGYYPGSYLNEPVVNIIKAVAGSMNLKVYYKDQTPQTWQADLHNDDIDIMIDEYNDIDMLSDALFTTRVVFVKHSDINLDKGGFVGVLDVGFIRDSAMAITEFHNAEYKYYAIPQMLIEDFELGYLDGVIANEVDYLTYCDLENVDYNVINTRDIYLVFENGDITLMDEFNQKLAELEANGMLEGLVYSD